MNRRKISAMLAVALITSQAQSITFAETISNNTKVEIINEVNIENLDESSLNSISNEISNTDNSENTLITDETIKSDEENDTNNELQSKVQNQTQNKIVGKLELDINFSTPIKNTNANETNISVKLTKDGKSYTVSLGSDISKGSIEGTDISYSLEALDYTRGQLSENATDLDFYHLTFENLDLGVYSLEISGAGYQTVSIDDIEIQNSSKRVLLGTADKTIVLDDNGTEDKGDDIVEEYLGSFLVGDVNGDGVVNNDDF